MKSVAVISDTVSTAKITKAWRWVAYSLVLVTAVGAALVCKILPAHRFDRQASVGNDKRPVAPAVTQPAAPEDGPDPTDADMAEIRQSLDRFNATLHDQEKVTFFLEQVFDISWLAQKICKDDSVEVA